MRFVKRYGDHISCTRNFASQAVASRILTTLMVVPTLRGMCNIGDKPLVLHSEALYGIYTRRLCTQGKLFKGAALFAPMLSLERASQHGLNYYLRSQMSVLNGLLHIRSDMCHV